DVGTNCEIVLGNANRLLATAAPAGPAFEAAQIRCGMRAADGAVEAVRIEGGELRVQVIGDVAPVGLCGSGLVDAVAELVRVGLVPRLPLARIVSAGNVAGEGAKMALLSVQERAGALALLEEVEYVELSDRPDFNDRFMAELAFPG